MNKMSEEIKISQLQEANEISANDLMMIIQNGVNKKKNIKQMAKELSTVAVSATQPITNKKVWFKIGKNKFDKSRYIENIATGASRTKNLKLEPNTVYTMSSNMTKTSSNTADLFFASGCNASVSTDANGVWNGQSRTVTSDENGYVTVAYRKQSTSQTPNLIDAWYQIEQGSKASAYEAYIEPTIFVKNGSIFEEFILKNEKKYFVTEQAIGTWIDGKTVYRKIIEATSPAVADTNTNIYNISDLNIKEVIKIEGIVYNKGSRSRGSINSYISADDYVTTWLYCEDTNKPSHIRYRCRNRTNSPMEIILEYTKN